MNEKLVTFAHISDTHLHADPNYVMEGVPHPAHHSVNKLIDFLNDFGAEIDLVLHTGDIMHQPADPQEYVQARALLDRLEYPVHYLPGNHDYVPWLQSHFVKPPQPTPNVNLDSTFEVNGVQFVLIDCHTPPAIRNAVGVFSMDQLRWLEEICTADDPRPLVVATHNHPLPLLAPWLDRIGTVNGEDMHEILLKARHRLRGVFHGHIHETLITNRDGINYISVQSAWYQTRTYHSQPEPARDPFVDPGFNLVTLTANDTFVRVVRVPLSS